MSLLSLLCSPRLSLLAVSFMLMGPQQIAAAKEARFNPFTTYPTELRFVSFDKHSAHLTVRPISSRKPREYPFYYPARESAQSWPVFIHATSDRPIYDMKREFRFMQTYESIGESLDYLAPNVVNAKIRRAMERGAEGDTKYPVGTYKTFSLVRLPRDASEMSILEHLHWNRGRLHAGAGQSNLQLQLRGVSRALSCRRGAE